MRCNLFLGMASEEAPCHGLSRRQGATASAGEDRVSRAGAGGMQDPEGPKGREEPDDADEASLPNGSEEEGRGDRILERVMHGGWTLLAPRNIETVRTTATIVLTRADAPAMCGVRRVPSHGPLAP